MNSSLVRSSLRLSAVLLLAAGACRSAADDAHPLVDSSANGPGGEASQAWSSFVAGVIESTFKAHPEIAVYQGRHEFDGELPDLSRSGLEREVQRLRTQLERARAFDEATLTHDQSFERLYVIARTDQELFWIESARWPFRCPAYYASAIDPDVYVSRDYAPLAVRMRAYTRFAANVPKAAAAVRANLATPMPRTYVDHGLIMFGGMASFCADDVPKIFAAVDDPALRKEFDAANGAAIAALRELSQWFEAQRATATDAFALGPELFAEMLRRTEGVDVPLDELETIGERDLERNLAALREACLVLAPGGPIEETIALVEADKPAEGAVAAARAQLPMLEHFVVDHALVGVPGTEQAEVAEAPPHKRWNFAYIEIPGSYEHGVPSTYCISPPNPAWSEKERMEYTPGKSDLLFTSVHEVWPGHFLHYLHANRSQSRFARIFQGYAYTEGWAHYSEEMMWDAGLGSGDPRVHIGQLLNATLRNARYLSAIGMHTRGMTVEQSEKLFRERAFQDAGTARQQAARGTFDPAYLSYTMGKLMIKKLRVDWLVQNGGVDALLEFHDRFLSYGGPPIPLVRQDMLGTLSGSLF
jgi:hypothetical protein